MLPSLGLLVNMTPLPLSQPIFPNTMVCTLQAVPIESGMPSNFRYILALGMSQLLKTAAIDALSWSMGSWGNSSPSSSLYRYFMPATVSLRPSTLTSVSPVTPSPSLTLSNTPSKACRSWPMTTSLNIVRKRLYASQTNRSSPVSLIIVSATPSFMPRLRTVSIMPGMLIGAPLLTLASSGFSGSLNFLPLVSSRVFTCSSTSSHSPSGNFPPAFMNSLQVFVVIVNPCGMLRPRLVISARLAPFPPRRAFMSLFPSVKSYTRFSILVFSC